MHSAKPPTRDHRSTLYRATTVASEVRNERRLRPRAVDRDRNAQIAIVRRGRQYKVGTEPEAQPAHDEAGGAEVTQRATGIVRVTTACITQLHRRAAMILGDRFLIQGQKARCSAD